MRYLLIVLVLLPTAAWAEGGFYGGMADGIQRSRELQLQRRALEMGDVSLYRQFQQEHQMRELERLLEENNRLLRDYEMRRRVYTP